MIPEQTENRILQYSLNLRTWEWIVVIYKSMGMYPSSLRDIQWKIAEKSYNKFFSILSPCDIDLSPT